MMPFEDKRARIEAYKRKKGNENSLNISEVDQENSDIVSFEVKGKGKEETTTPISSSLAEAAEVTLPVSFVPAWERYVNELQDDEQWIELVSE